MNIYLDNAATTPVDPLVTKAMFDWQKDNFGNPSSPHKHGQAAKIKMEEVRDNIASQLNCLSKEIVFTSGGTESNNKAIIGYSVANRANDSQIIVSGVEHHSVLTSTVPLEEKGFKVTYFNPANDGRIDLKKLREAINKETLLVTCNYVNNETGIIFPVKEIAKICKDNNVHLHCDAVQAFGKFELDVKELGVDLFSFSAHKIHGPKGVGGLYIKEGINLEELFFGGGQEANRRAGTENLTGIVGLGKAAELMQNNKDDRQKISKLSTSFEKIISDNIPNTVIIGENTERSPYISNISFLGVDNQSLLLKLDLNGLSVSVGSACSSGSIQQSHVLEAMKLPKEIISSSVRFSFSRFNTLEEIDKATEIVKQVVKELRK